MGIRFLLIIACILVAVVAQPRKSVQRSPEEIQQIKEERKALRKSMRSKAPPEKGALTAWAQSLSDEDYDVEHWRVATHSSSASDWFHHYARRISALFKKNGAKVNFALVGACDGTGDKTIKTLYLPNEHWRGVFVEPMSINVRDLIKFLAEHNIAHRSLVLRGAATMQCAAPTLKIERPLYEEKNASIPHWLRRQINSVLPPHRDHARKEWVVEEVRCLTGPDILREWGRMSPSSSAGSASIGDVQAGGAAGSRGKRSRRPHILKIDVEGHDYEVLMGFMAEDAPVSSLPLIVAFEAKSIAKKFPKVKARMEQLGYVVSPFGQDGFAILPAALVLKGLQDASGLSGDVDGVPGDHEHDV